MKTYIIKVGSQYVTANGTLSDRQPDALRIVLQDGQEMRAVKLVPKANLHGNVTDDSMHDDDLIPVDQD